MTHRLGHFQQRADIRVNHLIGVPSEKYENRNDNDQQGKNSIKEQFFLFHK
jgi:hypothetical protein